MKSALQAELEKRQAERLLKVLQEKSVASGSAKDYESSVGGSIRTENWVNNHYMSTKGRNDFVKSREEVKMNDDVRQGCQPDHSNVAPKTTCHQMKLLVPNGLTVNNNDRTDVNKIEYGQTGQTENIELTRAQLAARQVLRKF